VTRKRSDGTVSREDSDKRLFSIPPRNAPDRFMDPMTAGGVGEGSLHEVKRLGRAADHPRLSCAEPKMRGDISTHPSCSYIHTRTFFNINL
jgi:hypothetical protein